jgi:hypothetical protein
MLGAGVTILARVKVSREAFAKNSGVIPTLSKGYHPGRMALFSVSPGGVCCIPWMELPRVRGRDCLGTLYERRRD